MNADSVGLEGFAARPQFEAQNELTQILDHVDQGIIVCDAGGDLVFVNIAAAQMFGFSSASELIEASPDALTTYQLLLDEQGVPVDFNQLLESPATVVADDAAPIVQLKSREGSEVRWFRVRVRPLYGADKAIRLTVAVWEDVTERRRSGERNRLLAAIVATSDDAIVSKTLDGTVTSWNRAAERLYGWSAEEMVGNSIARIVPPDKLQELGEILARLGRGESVEHHETARITRDGRRINVAVSISPILDGEGRVVGAAKIGRDITARLEAERAADTFLVDLAHDVNNPLATARIQTQLLQRRLSRGPVSEQSAQDALTAIETSITRVARRIGELADVSRLRLNGSIELKIVEVDIVSILTELIKSHQQHDRLKVELAYETLLGAWDAERIERVFDNLITNALKYSEAPSEVVIRLDMAGSGAGREAVVTVSDSGIGIPAIDLPFIFDRFRRGSNVVNRTAGSGIGLAGTHQIVTMHGGTILIESQPGTGTTVTVRLPIQRLSEQAAD